MWSWPGKCFVIQIKPGFQLSLAKVHHVQLLYLPTADWVCLGVEVQANCKVWVSSQRSWVSRLHGGKVELSFYFSPTLVFLGNPWAAWCQTNPHEKPAEPSELRLRTTLLPLRATCNQILVFQCRKFSPVLSYNGIKRLKYKLCFLRACVCCVCGVTFLRIGPGICVQPAINWNSCKYHLYNYVYSMCAFLSSSKCHFKTQSLFLGQPEKKLV